MANIGEQLLQPESGMQRIDDVNINIKYINASYIYDDSNMFNFSNQNRHIINKDGNCEFYIYSSKFYILAGAHHTYDTSYCQIMIDDITYEVSLYTSDTLNNANNQGSHVVYKFKSDKKSIHHIKLNAIKDFNFDAIDIDENGYMLYCDDNGKLYYDMTPIMTANTTGNYVVSASSYYGVYLPYLAFNGQIGENNAWISRNSSDYIQIGNNSEKIKTNTIFIKYNNGDNVNSLPKEIEIYGSDDQITENLLGTYSFSNKISYKMMIKLNNIYSYKYFKINILSTQENYPRITIPEMRFLLDTQTSFYLIQDNVDNKIYNYDEENNTLVEVTDTSILKADALNNTCIYDLNKVIPLLDTLSDDLTILCNNDRKLIAKGIKSNLELITSKQILSANIAHLIRELEVICTLVGNGNIKVIVSRDRGNTWSYWDTTSNAWLNLANTVTKRDYNSMTDTEKEKWEALKQEAWQYGMTPNIVKIADFEFIKDNGFKFAFVLSRPTYEDNAVLKELDWTYDEDGGYIVLNNTDILIKKTDKYIKLVPQRNMTDVKVEIVN